MATTPIDSRRHWIPIHLGISRLLHHHHRNNPDLNRVRLLVIYRLLYPLHPRRPNPFRILIPYPTRPYRSLLPQRSPEADGGYAASLSTGALILHWNSLPHTDRSSRLTYEAAEGQSSFRCRQGQRTMSEYSLRIVEYFIQAGGWMKRLNPSGFQVGKTIQTLAARPGRVSLAHRRHK